MAKKAYYIRLDHDWMKDSKVRNVAHLGGKAALINVIQLYIVLSRNKGEIRWDDYGQKADAMDFMGLSERKLEEFLDLAAECDLIRPDVWRELRVATSERAKGDADLTSARSSAGRAGGETSGESRRSK